MRIEEEIKLDYTDVLFRPKRSTLKSRKDVDLNRSYTFKHSKLKWKCSNGHVWQAKPSNIKSGKWCPNCAGNIPLSIKEMKMIAEERGGQCLSKKYFNSHLKLKWKCFKGHIWKATPHMVKMKTWCPKCAIDSRRKNHKSG